MFRRQMVNQLKEKNKNKMSQRKSKVDGSQMQKMVQKRYEQFEKKSNKFISPMFKTFQPNVGGSEHLREQLVDRPVATGGPQLNVDDLQDLDEV